LLTYPELIFAFCFQFYL